MITFDWNVTYPVRDIYIIRWNNGVWKIFNTQRYEDCESFPTLDIALKALYA